MHLDWKTSLTFMFESPAFRQAWIWGGAFILVCPPIGWPIALGYRSLVLRHLLDTGEVPQIQLPSEARKCLLSGISAVAVIFCYFLPFMLLYWSLGASAHDLIAHPLEVAVFFLLVFFLVPGFLPTLPIFYAWHFPWIDFSTTETNILAIIFCMTTFLMPAVFMQVSVKGSYWGAMCTGRAIRTIIEYPALYLEAWILSLVLISLSIVVFPLFPWITFWAYLAIGLLFNNVLIFNRSEEVKSRVRLVASRLKT